MKILLGVIIVIICVIIAYNLASKYTLRKNFYQAFNGFNKRLCNEVIYTKKTIIEILSASNDTEEFNVLLSKYFKTKEKPSLNPKIYDLNERNYFNEYIDGIGNTDSNAQLLFIKSADKYLEEKLAAVMLEEKKYKSLYVKLGFLFGLLIFVIII